jgi:hypothetical protein
MATPTREFRSASELARGASGLPQSAPLEFFVFEDNDGAYHWAIVGGSGKGLAQSGSFGSYEEAAHAGRFVHDCAESARFERRAEDAVVDVLDRREKAMSDDFDVGRWLDEGGSFRS